MMDKTAVQEPQDAAPPTTPTEQPEPIWTRPIDREDPTNRKFGLPDSVSQKMLPAWGVVEDDMKTVFPDLDHAKLEKEWTHARNLSAARAWMNVPVDPGIAQGASEPIGMGQKQYLKGTPATEGVLGMVPFASITKGLASQEYANAKSRFHAGEAEPRDYWTIAAEEATQADMAKQTGFEKFGQGVGRGLGMLGEQMLGGAALKGLAPITGASFEAAQGASLGTRLAVGGARAAATTAIAPSFWMPEWTETNMVAGRDPGDLRGLPAAYAHGLLYNALLEGTGGLTNKLLPPGTIRGTVGRVPAAAATGVAAGQAADAVGGMMQYASGLPTDFGILGDLARGKKGEAAQRFAQSAILFGAFAAVHQGMDAAQGQTKQVLDDVAEGLRREGIDPKTADLGKLAKVFEEKTNDWNNQAQGNAQAPAPAPPAGAENRQGVQGQGQQAQVPKNPVVPGGSAGIAGQGAGGAIDNAAPAQPSGQPRAANGAVGDTGAPAPAAAPGEGNEAQGRPKPAAAEEPAGGQQRVLSTFSDQDVTDLAKSLGFPTKGNREAVVGRMVQSLGEPMLRQIEGAAAEAKPTNVKGPTAPLPPEATPPEAPGSTEPSAEAKGGPEAPEEASKPQEAADQHVQALKARHEAGEVLPEKVVEGLQYASHEGERSPSQALHDNIQALTDELGKRFYEAGLSGQGPKPIMSTTPKMLLDRVDRGEGNLTDEEKHVMLRRLAHEASFRDIDPEIGSGKRGTAANREKSALEKLGYTGKVQELLDARAAQARVENGEDVAAQEFHRVDPRRTLSNERAKEIADAADKIFDLKKKMQKEEDNGELTDESHAKYREDIQGYRRIIDQGNEEAGAHSQEPEAAQRVPGQPEAAVSGNQAEGPSFGAAALKPPGGRAPGPLAKEVQPAGPEAPPGKFASDKTAVQHFVDYVKELSGQMFPDTTRIDPKTGEAMSRMVASQQFVEDATRYYNNILGIDKMSPEERKAVGATFLEARFRHARQYFFEEATKASDRAIDARNKAATETDAVKKKSLQAESVRSFNEADDLRNKSRAIGTLVGSKDSPIQSEQDFQDMWDSPRMFGFREAWAQEFRPEMERSYRQAKGLDEHDIINGPTQMPGYPLNAKAVQEGTPNSTRVSGRGNLDNVKIRKMGFTNQASLAADAYETDIGEILRNSLQKGVFPARQAEFYRTAVENGVGAWGTPAEHPEGWKHIPDSKPPKGTQEAETGQTFYAHPDAFGEIRKALSLDEPPGRMLSAVKMAPDALNTFSLMSVAELASHVANLSTAQFQGGMRPQELFTEGYKVLKADPEAQRRIMELARIGAMHEYKPNQGVASAVLKKLGYPEAAETAARYDPTRVMSKWTSGAIDLIQKATRLQLDNAYTRLVDAKQAPDTETGRRDFINQAVGQYNSKATNKIVQFFRDSGLGPFAVAGVKFTEQGIRKAYGGGTNVDAPTLTATIQLRAQMLGKLLPFLAAPMAANYLRYGNIFGDDETPVFSFKTDNGHFDPLAFTGLRRGWRATGANALIEGMRKGKTAGQIGDQAVRDIWRAAVHPFAGPIVQAAETVATGENAIGHRVSPQVSKAHTGIGASQAEAKGLVPPGSGQYWQNAKAALANVNPVIGTFTEADRPRTPRTFMQNITRSVGPFGEKQRYEPQKRGPIIVRP